MQRSLKKVKAFLRKKGKLIFGSIAFLLFALNYQICEFFYEDDITRWWYLKSDLLAMSVCSSLVASRIRTGGLTRIILTLGVGWSISDVIDRVFFDVRYFTNVDIVMIVLTVIYACYDTYNNE